MKAKEAQEGLPTKTRVEALPYVDFLDRFQWKQGEHIGLIGPTGLGKTTLSLDLMQHRDYVCILGTKPRDENLSRFLADNNYRRLKEFPRYFDETQHTHIAVWPKLDSMGKQGNQRAAIGHALQQMFKQGRWCINADEVSYIGNDLHLEPHLKLIWQQGRSLDLSLVAGTQRPVNVPLFIYDQSTHLFFFKDNDEANLRRIGGIGWLNARLIRETVARLPRYYFLYTNTRTGDMVISKKQLKKG